MDRIIRVYGVWCVLMLLATGASATTIVLPTDDQLITKAEVIVEGEVVATTPYDRGGAIWTETTIAVSKTLKGHASGTIAVREPGGELDVRVTKVFGAPEFQPGEQVLLFLDHDRGGGYRVVDLFVGKFEGARTKEGKRIWKRNDAASEAVLLDAEFRPIHAKNVQREAKAFERYVSERVAGRAGSRNYGVESPVLANQEDGGTTTGGVQSDFTLIAEPTLYRWFRFDTGSDAVWYSAGTQPGYSGGGVNELKTGMASWTSYTAAKILYTYAGTRSGTLGGLSSANGVNEILFNDPLDEITGSWSPSTGGVVGTGGFNSVTSGGTWEAPFTADPSHPAGPVRAYNIAEGNLTIQDNVSAANGISSAVLAEILAHEFGHTLGFGHSADSTALMYATVTRIGPHLREDDKVAARWLYPNGAVTTPAAPAAPSNLRVTSTTTSSVDLAWNDNASDETGHALWVAAGSSTTFSRVAEVGANVTSTRVSLASGSYRMYVQAVNAAGASQSNTVSFTIATAAPNPVAVFSVSPTSGTAGVTTFAFSDASTGTIATRHWSFGDGTTASVALPTHVYQTAGEFTVTLTVTGNGVTSQASKVISVAAATPVTPSVTAAFDVSTSSPAIGQSVQFTDRSGGSPTRWSWSFGDGATSALQSPAHTYAGPGTYTVTLTASSSVSTSVATKSVTVASVVPYRTLVSAAAQTDGVGGTSWRTELSLFNAGAQGASVSILYLPSSGGSVLANSLYLQPKQSVTYSNALLELFGLSTGAGALAIEAASSGTTADLRVTSRTFTTAPIGTYGQSVPGVVPDALTSTLFITGMESTASFRTNVGVVNRAPNAVTVALALFNSSGSQLGTRSVTIPANSFQQQPLSAWFSAVEGRSYERLTMRITAATNAAISAYASVIDNTTQDPVYIQAVPPASGGTLTVPVVGRAPGANATFWRSDVTLYNPTSSRVVLALRYGGTTKSLALDGGETQLLADILAQFGHTSGSGALQVSWSGSTGPVVTSRTYTSVSTGGTYGQSIDPVASFGSMQFVPGLRNDAAFRTNVGFVNGGAETETFDVKLLSQWGTELGRTTLTLAPNAQVQHAVLALFPHANVSAFTLQLEGDANAKLFAYGSMVDNLSGDPVFFAAE